MSQGWDWPKLLADALKIGLSVGEFWRMTPRETALAFEAAMWRYDRERQQAAWLAWHIAALGRAKRLPSLRRLMRMPAAKKLSGDEAAKRAHEHAEMVKRMAWPLAKAVWSHSGTKTERDKEAKQ